MRARSIVRVLDYFVEACWLLAIVAVPIFFDTMTVRIFEPDKIVLFRNIVLLMVVAALLRAVVAAPAAMVRTSQARTRAPDEGAQPTAPAVPWWRAPINRRPLLIPVAIFAVIYSAATATSVLPGISLWGSFDRLQGLYTWLTYIAFFLILSYSIRSWAQIERIISAIVFASLPVALYGIVQHLQWDPVGWGADTSTRVASTLGNSIFLGAYLIMCMPFTAYRLWRAVAAWRPSTPAPVVEPAPRERSSGRRAATRQTWPAPRDTVTIMGLHPVIPVIGYALVLIASFAALYFCGSRGPYYGFAAATVALGIPLTLKFKTPYPLMVGIGLLIVEVGFPQLVDALSPLPALIIFLLAVGVVVFQSVRKLQRPYLAVALGGAFLVMALTFPQAINVLNPALNPTPGGAGGKRGHERDHGGGRAPPDRFH